MEFIASLSKMSMVLVAIAAGYLANKLHIMGGETDQKITKDVYKRQRACRGGR